MRRSLRSARRRVEYALAFHRFYTSDGRQTPHYSGLCARSHRTAREQPGDGRCTGRLIIDRLKPIDWSTWSRQYRETIHQPL